MNRLDEPQTVDGPVIDMEPAAAEAGAPRAGFRRAALAGAGVLALAAAMLAGAYLYGKLGSDLFGGAVSDRLGALETRLAAMEENAAKQVAERQAVADRLDGLGQAVEGFSGLQARLTAIESQQAALGSSVEALQKQPPGPGGADPAILSQIQAELKDLQARLAAVPAVDPMAARLASALGSGQPLGPDLDRIADPAVKTALAPFRDQPAPSRAALAQELAQIAAVLGAAAPGVDTVQGDGWDDYFYRQLSRFFTIRPSGTGLAAKLEAAARAQDIAGAVALLNGQSAKPEQAWAWLAKAEGLLAAEAAIARLKAGAN